MQDNEARLGSVGVAIIMGTFAVAFAGITASQSPGIAAAIYYRALAVLFVAFLVWFFTLWISLIRKSPSRSGRPEAVIFIFSIPILGIAAYTIGLGLYATFPRLHATSGPTSVIRAQRDQLSSSAPSTQSSSPGANVPEIVEAVAAVATAIILGFTLRAALKNLHAFEKAAQIERTTDLFRDYHSRVYARVPDVANHSIEEITPFVAMSELLSQQQACREICIITAHNFLEMVATLHSQGLLADNVFFDSFATTVVGAYNPLAKNLDRLQTPLTTHSRIPMLLSDAAAFLAARAQEPTDQAHPTAR
jgi:hypothetical protein